MDIGKRNHRIDSGDLGSELRGGYIALPENRGGHSGVVVIGNDPIGAGLILQSLGHFFVSADPLHVDTRNSCAPLFTIRDLPPTTSAPYR